MLIQSSLGQPEHNPRSVAALRRLRKRPGVELIGKAAALAPAEYYELASQADIMLLPYLRGRYRGVQIKTGIHPAPLALFWLTKERRSRR